MREKSIILIVDGDPEVRTLVANSIQQEGYTARTAGDGPAALGLFEKEHIDVALVNLEMPEIDGVELCKQIKETHPGTEVVVIAGRSSVASALATLREVVFDYVLKPLNATEISHTVRQALEKQRLLAEREKLREELSAVNEKLRRREKELEKEIQETTGLMKESERRWRTLFENANDIIFVVDKSGLLTAFNPGAERLLGYKTEEVEGKSLEELVFRGSKKKVRELLDRTVLEAGVVFGQEVKLRCKGGRELVVEINASPLHDENGQVIGGLGTARDITGRKQTERKLRELNRRLSAEKKEMERLNQSLTQAYAQVRASQDILRYLLDSANNAVLFLELDGTITGVNTKAKELFGYSRDEFLEMDIYQLMPRSFFERTGEMLRKLRMGMSDSFLTEVLMKDRSVLKLELNASIVEQEKRRVGLIFFREPMEKTWKKDRDIKR